MIAARNRLYSIFDCDEKEMEFTNINFKLA